MIPRTRPTININHLYDCLLKKANFQYRKPNNIFFLSSGYACLSVFLKQFQNKRIGIQVFTCPTVLDCILKEGHYPIFMDINKEYYTTTKDIIEKHINEIDILILTHLFGIPNPDYFDIVELCKKNNVILIDDLCQTYKAQIKGLYIEDISSNYFYSFFSDKPISCASGGMLKVSAEYINNIENITQKYRKQTMNTGKRNLLKLYNLHRLLSSNIYKKDFRNGNLLENIILERYLVKWSESLLYKILTSRLIRVINRFIPKYNYENKNEIMSDIQIEYINKRFETFSNTTHLLYDYYKLNNYPLPAYLLNPNIKCSCAQRAIVRIEHSKIPNAEIYLYNWPFLIDKGFYPNADYVIKNYVNIPIPNIKQ